VDSHRSGSDRSAFAETCERIRRHLERGAPWDASDVYREAIARHPGDAELLYWGALAHARAGASHQAHALIDRAIGAAQASPALQAEMLSLRARLWKDVFHRAPDAPGAREAADRARREYLAAYAIAHDPYPGINAATMSLLVGDRAAARRLAGEIVERLAAQRTPATCWDHATAGEARVLLGRLDDARTCYAAAYAGAPGDAGSVATMRRQVRLLARVLPEAAQILPALPAADVVAFAGHMIDAPGRAVPRFPPALVPAVAATLRAHLARLHQPVVYTSAACGADLLFIEAAQEVGAEVNVVLPFDRADFVRTSVAAGGDDWVRRFDRALARADRVIAATDESHLGDDELFEYAALLVEGLAVLRASQLESSPSLLCVVDAGTEVKVGGARASFERWSRNVGPPQTIDLRVLRASIAAAAPGGTAAVTAPAAATAVPAEETPRPPEAHGSPAAIADLATRPRRTLKTLLFADVAGYSRLDDAYAPLFQDRFWRLAAREIDASASQPLLTNSWGDALYAVFPSPADGAEFALRLLRGFEAEDWASVGLPDARGVRIALHAGPVFCGFDPIIGRDNYFGSSVTRAARIEPVTPPGTVYASEAFAALMAASGQDAFATDYVGRLPLAKGYGEARLYVLRRN
jgi:hypothetical protein